FELGCQDFLFIVKKNLGCYFYTNKFQNLFIKEPELLVFNCHSNVFSFTGARLKAKALEIEHYAKLEAQYMAKKGELNFVRNQIRLELQKEKALSNIEVKRFSDMVKAIGADTLAAIATAGPDTQVCLN
ncbi:major vault protein-like, partial [Ruditapes philippinarum]|uniref:major vault protein-like n=1 Tax=Ruditapes philippinarum TaxID=129788 RepID=UPI00295BA19D